jgi:regulator of RNase E activity RraA
MRDVTRTMSPSIKARNKQPKFIGRAFTVKGPDIYINAVEQKVPEGSVFVQAHTDDIHSVWNDFIANTYARPRGIVAAVIDGGIDGSEDIAEGDFPVFARFVSPLPAINRKEGPTNVPLVCGGVTVEPGDIILGDVDGVVVIPKCHQDVIYQKLDGFLNGSALFVKIATETPNIVVSKHEALGEMFELKYQHPYDYWRYYEPWAAKWRKKYAL